MAKYNNAFLIAGYRAAGKSTVLDICDNFEDIFCYDMDNFIGSCYDSDQVTDDIELIQYASRRKETNGRDYFAEQIIGEISKLTPSGKSVAVSNIYSSEEVMAFIESELFDNVTVIAVVANENTRWERFKKRDNVNRSDFDELNDCEQSWGLDYLIRHCDVFLSNDFTTKERFRNKVEFTIEELMRNPEDSWS